MIQSRILAVAAAMLVFFCAGAFAASHPGPAANKTLELFQGGVVELKIAAPVAAVVEGRFGKQTIVFTRAEGDIFTALVGADLEAKPGTGKISIKQIKAGGGAHDSHIAIQIKRKQFPQESFSVPPSFDELGPEALERIRAEQERLGRVLSASAAPPLWQKPFVMPVQADISSPFGYRRVINGLPRAPHAGVDLRAPIGTEVLAVNRGRVALLADFFFSGKSLVLDHGGGLCTLYFHLSEFKVTEGTEVQRGDVVALSGMSGRVTGPHLHWGAWLGGARVDPAELVRSLGAVDLKHSPAAVAVDGTER